MRDFSKQLFCKTPVDERLHPCEEPYFNRALLLKNCEEICNIFLELIELLCKFS